MNITRFSALVFAVFLILPACAQPSKTTTTETGAYTLVFNEELRFGSQNEDSHYQWPDPGTTITVDKQGRMYIADLNEQRVLQFDANGTFQKLIAKQGPGPGEFQKLLGFTVLTDGSAVGYGLVGDIRPQVQQFDQNMVFTKSYAKQGRPQILQQISFSPKGDQFASFYVQPDGPNKVMKFRVAVIGTDFEEKMVISAKTGPLPNRARFRDPSYWSERLAGNLERFFAGIGIFNFDGEGNVYTAKTNRYEITKWSPDMKTKLLTVEHKYKPMVVSDADREAALDHFAEQIAADPVLAEIVNGQVLRQALNQADLPPAKNPVHGIIPMEDGKFLVVHDLDLQTRKDTAHLFSKKGEFMGQVEMPDHAFLRFAGGGYVPKMIFKNGKAYTLLTDENMEHSAVRYSYKLLRN